MRHNLAMRPRRRRACCSNPQHQWDVHEARQNFDLWNRSAGALKSQIAGDALRHGWRFTAQGPARAMTNPRPLKEWYEVRHVYKGGYDVSAHPYKRGWVTKFKTRAEAEEVFKEIGATRENGYRIVKVRGNPFLQTVFPMRGNPQGNPKGVLSGPYASREAATAKFWDIAAVKSPEYYDLEILQFATGQWFIVGFRQPKNVRASLRERGAKWVRPNPFLQTVFPMLGNPPTRLDPFNFAIAEIEAGRDPRRELLKRYTRAQLIGALQSNDPNGMWTDRKAALLGVEPLSHSYAVQNVFKQALEGGVHWQVAKAFREKFGIKENPSGKSLGKYTKRSPYAICTASVGRRKKAKYERCVRAMKRKVRTRTNTSASKTRATWYIGVNLSGLAHVFESPKRPTKISHRNLTWALGPFKSKDLALSELAKRYAKRKIPATSIRNGVQGNPPDRCPYKVGQRVSIDQWRAWLKKSGQHTALEKFNRGIALQKKANGRCGDVLVADEKELGVAPGTTLVHYGSTDETTYKAPKGSIKGKSWYRHEWGEGKGKKKRVPLLVDSGGKKIVIPLGKGQKAGDWLRG